MKTYTLSGLAGLFLIVFFSPLTLAQVCTPDPQYTAPGIYPDSATGFAPAIQCTYYEQLITNIVPVDTNAGFITCDIDSVVLDAVTGLPPGLTYACSPPSCGYPGGTTGCAIVYGIPTDTGTYPIVAATSAYISGGFLNLCNGQSPVITNITYYTVVVTSPITFATNGPACNGGCNGQATATVTGPPAPYTYMWNDGQTTATAVGLCAGTYSVTVTDSTGCTSINSVTLNGTSSIANTFTTTPQTCYGGCDATATALSSGGTPPYSYLWSDPQIQTVATATGLCAGSYAVTITDSSGCSTVDSVAINSLFPYDVGVLPTDASSFDTCDGSATALLIGGSSPFTYLWNNGQTSSTASSLCAGVHCVTVTDSIGCTATNCDTVGQPSPPPIVITITSFDASCNGSCDGVATVSVTGGVPPYSPQWNNGLPTYTATGLCAGSYQVVVTDSLGTTATDSVTIGEPPVFSIDSMVTMHASSYGACDGSVLAWVSGGTPAYAYSWSNGSIGSSSTALCAGSVCLTVTDANGCYDFSCDSIVQPPPPPIVPTTVGFDASCNGSCDGYATVTATGGVPPYNYLWNDPGMQTNVMASGLCAGSFQVIVTDALGAMVTDNVTIGEPTLIVATYTSVPSTCGNADGSGCIIATGGAGGYSYLWDNGSTASCATGLLSGTYSVTITDQDSCSTNITVLINDVGGPSIDSIFVIDISCYGDSNGAATAYVSAGSPPLTYTWQDNQANVIGSTIPTVIGLWGDTYTLTVTDNNGCQASSSFAINEPAVLSATPGSTSSSCSVCDGTASVAVTGGMSPYGYIWTDPNTQSTATATGLCSGMYICSVFDQNGCVTNALSTVVSLNAPAVSFTSANVSCAGACDGSAIITTTGGIFPYTHTWSNGNTSSIATSLCAGSYTVIVADSTGCDTTITIVITEPSVLGVTSTSTNATCGQCNGTGTVMVTGGTPPYDYLWSPPPGTGDTSSYATGLCPGSYMTFITDANGCFQTYPTSIGSSSSPLGSLGISNVSCNGACDGIVTVAMTGGIAALYLCVVQWRQLCNRW